MLEGYRDLKMVGIMILSFVIYLCFFNNINQTITSSLADFKSFFLDFFVKMLVIYIISSLVFGLIGYFRRKMKREPLSNQD